MSNTNLQKAAEDYLNSGLSAVPAIPDQKRPSIGSWKHYQQRLPTEQEVRAWFSNPHRGLCVITGAVSGNLEIMDFDNGGELFDKWYALIEPQLRDKLVIEQTPSGGWHVIYRCSDKICGNLKLAQRKEGKLRTLIETRGEGGLFLCAPTPGYEIMQGELVNVPILTAEQRESLLETAWSLNEYIPQAVSTPPPSASDNTRPGDDYNDRGDIASLLQAHGWQLAHTSGENQRWRRPGKNKGWSATLRTSDNLFYIFSSNAPPFEPGKAYTPFSVYTMLECGGDYTRAASELSNLGYGRTEPDYGNIDISGICDIANDHCNAQIKDPGPIPLEMLRIPGTVSEIMDYCIENAPTRNVAMSFCGALAIQSFLGARKVRDAADNRTNIYLAALAPSGSGKEFPRKVSKKVLEYMHMSRAFVTKFASGEALEDKLLESPSILALTDEMDGLMLQIKNSSDGRYEGLTDRFKELFSCSDQDYVTRCKAGKQGQVVHQPSLTMMGTAIPSHYYSALSEKMLTDGFLARTISVDAADEVEDQEPAIVKLPERIIETALWWSQFNPSNGNIADFNPEPAVVAMSDRAVELIKEVRQMARHEQNKANENNDIAACAIWSRVRQMTRKLALIYAISADYKNPQIDEKAVMWARDFIIHQAKRMLFMVTEHVSENDFDAICKKVLRIIRKEGGSIDHSVLLRKSKLKSREFNELITTLLQREEIFLGSAQTRGRVKTLYSIKAE